MIQILKRDGKVEIAGDGLLLAKLPPNFDVSEVELKDTRIDANNLVIAANAASYRGVEAVKYYAALREAFLTQQHIAFEFTINIQEVN